MQSLPTRAESVISHYHATRGSHTASRSPEPGVVPF